MKNIFVFGADEFNLAQMRALKDAGHYRFHELFQYRDVKAGRQIPARSLYEGALARLNGFTGTIDAIVGYWDFPVSTMLPLLRKPFGLPSPSFEALLKCEHKFWSRVQQRQVIPDHVPRFCVFDPFLDTARRDIRLPYPFWIKPVKAASSYLAFKVTNNAEWERALESIRNNIFRIAEPFNYLLQFADLPDEIASVGGYHCIAEEVISRGRQVTLEGYAYGGEVCVYGIIDSIREGRHRSCFARYQYPSTIPRRIQDKMVAITQRFVRHIDFDNGPFNIEYYWDTRDDRIWLLEINPRISKSHCPLFRNVDGVSHHQVMLDLGLGRHPNLPHRQGVFRCAAKFMWRVYSDAIVKRSPAQAELAAIRRCFPSVEIQLHVHEGMRLSELRNQDSYSYEVAVVFLGADNQKQLLEKYRTVQEALPLELAPLG